MQGWLRGRSVADLCNKCKSVRACGGIQHPSSIRPVSIPHPSSIFQKHAGFMAHPTPNPSSNPSNPAQSVPASISAPVSASVSALPHPSATIKAHENALITPHSTRRRLRSISLIFILWGTVTIFLPILLFFGVFVDIFRKIFYKIPATTLRLLPFGWSFLTAEVVGIFALFFSWLTYQLHKNRLRFLDETYTIQSAWTRFLFRSISFFMQISYDIQGTECAKKGPYLLLVRHTSIIDTLLPSVFITQKHGVRLRFALKSELLADPCLDIAGNRLPNAFLRRDRRNKDHDSNQEIDKITALLERDGGVGERDGILIYPEGTRFTKEKQQKILAELLPELQQKIAREQQEQEKTQKQTQKSTQKNNAELLAILQKLQFVLPPKIGGMRSVLQKAQELRMPLDIVFFAHTGLDHFANVMDIWRGKLVGSVVRGRLWRISSQEIPTESDAQMLWLCQQWARVDDAVQQMLLTEQHHSEDKS